METKHFKSVDDYIANQPEDIRQRLEELRSVIKSTAPEAEETISYNMPAFRLHGMLVGFAAWKKHCGFYPWNGRTVADFQKDLENYKTSSGAIQLPNDQPLPKALLRKIISARVKENSSKLKT
jgi:uncharacterized protein YdhG (YjbR/CyaY superfamily)